MQLLDTPTHDGRSRSASRRPPEPRAINGFMVVRFVCGLMVLGFAVAALAQFCLLWRASAALDRAARVALEEACLPHASRASIESSVMRALSRTSLSDIREKIAHDTEITIGGRSDLDWPIDRAAHGDLVGVSLSMPAAGSIGDALAPLGLSIRAVPIRVSRRGRAP